MRIPHDPMERQLLYDELQRACLTSRNDRFEFYKQLRNYYLFGSAGNEGSPFNRIGSTVDTLVSFIYSPDSTRFDIHLGGSADHEDIFKAPPLAHEVTDHWRMSSTHLRFGLALRWSFVFGSMLMKIMWDRRAKSIRSYLVEPHQFGVLREDVLELADQEAFCMTYTTTKTQLASSLEGNPRKESIMARVGKATGDAHGTYGEGLQRLILGGPVAGVSGSVAIGSGGGYVDGGLGGSRRQDYGYVPKVESELIDMVDLYVYDDATNDYQLVTIASPNVVIYDRPQSVVGIPHFPHFAVIRPEHNLYDYFWGESFVARLTWLQEWRTERLMQIRGIMGKQFDPPISSRGLGGITEEKLLALRSAGGRLTTPPGASGDLEFHYPQMPDGTLSELSQIDQMFDEVAGIGHILQGKGESGVRSKGQADLMARLGSSRPKHKAIIAEEAAEDVANLMLHNIQENSEQRFIAKLPDGKDLTFSAKQFTLDYEVKVDAHSSSPIFVEDRKHDAVEMFEAKAIDRETLLDMFDPPNVQMLKERLKKIEEKEAAQAKMQAQLEAQKGK